MLPKEYRLPSSDISRVMRSGRRIVGSGMTLVYCFFPQSGGQPTKPRFAFIVSKNVDKRATTRNRVKRLLGESIRHLLPEIKKPVEVVVIGSKQLIPLTEMEVEKRMIEVLGRL